MAIRPKSKINPNFSMSSMTDIIFLLLVFFMVSSSYINIKGIAVEKPISTTAKAESIVIILSIDRDGAYYYEQELTTLDDIEHRLKLRKGKDENLSVSVNADKNASIEKLVKLMDIAKRNGIKLVLATR